MKGALIFLIAFFAVLLLSLAVPGIPPGRMIYDAVVSAETDYPVLGIPATTLVAAVFNAVIYGIIIWLIYDLFIARKRPKETKKMEEKVASGPGTQP